MRTIVVLLTLALAGCGGGYSSNDDSDAAMLLMGATAFSNGYTQAQPRPMITCFNTGMMTMCQ